MKYAIAVNDLGTDYVHRYVGKEPSGLRFNKLFLNEDGKLCVQLSFLNMVSSEIDLCDREVSRSGYHMLIYYFVPYKSLLTPGHYQDKSLRFSW